MKPSPITRYAYKASLIGSAHQFELTEPDLSWQIAGRSGVWAYADIAAVRLSLPAGIDAVASLSRRHRKCQRRRRIRFSRPPGRPSR